MSMKYCIKINHREVCIPVPVQYNRYWWVKKPEPIPWVEDIRLSLRTVHDISVLATISDLADELTSEMRDALYNQVKVSISKLKLPKGAEVKFVDSMAARNEVGSEKV